MILTQILQPTCIKAPLASTNKDDAIEELINLLADSGCLAERGEALEAVLAREQTRSTGIGSGIAIPHGKCSAAKELVMAVGIATDPIEFDSIDRMRGQVLEAIDELTPLGAARIIDALFVAKDEIGDLVALETGESGEEDEALGELVGMLLGFSFEGDFCSLSEIAAPERLLLIRIRFQRFAMVVPIAPQRPHPVFTTLRNLDGVKL